MRIDAYSQISKLYQTNKPKKVTKTNAAAVKEEYQVSKSGQDYQIAKNAISELPEVREEKVKELKEALSSGNYNVSSQEIAESMVSKYFDSVL